MKKIYSTIIVILFFCIPTFGQQKLSDVIYLKNSEKYIGKIILKTKDIVMIEVEDGKRFQIPTSDILEIKQGELKNDEQKQTPHKNENFAGLLQFSGDISSLKGAINPSPSVDMSASLGSKKAFGKNIFLGLGGGLETIFDGKGQRVLGYFPLFAHIKTIYSEKNISPATNIKLGYAVPFQKSYSGGLFLNTSGGISFKNSEKTNTYLGLYIKLQSTSGNISENTPQGDFTSKSNGIITSFGIATAFIF